MARIHVSGDVALNPGPDKCTVCLKTVASNHRAVNCDECNNWVHIKCGKIKPKQYEAMQLLDNFEWVCPPCQISSQVQGLSNEEAENNLNKSSIGSLCM